MLTRGSRLTRTCSEGDERGGAGRAVTPISASPRVHQRASLTSLSLPLRSSPPQFDSSHPHQLAPFKAPASGSSKQSGFELQLLCVRSQAERHLIHPTGAYHPTWRRCQIAHGRQMQAVRVVSWLVTARIETVELQK